MKTPSEYLIQYTQDGDDTLRFRCGSLLGSILFHSTKDTEGCTPVTLTVVPQASVYTPTAQRDFHFDGNEKNHEFWRQAILREIFEWAKFQHAIDKLQRAASGKEAA